MLANHLWQSTIFAVLAAILAFTLRNNRPSVRYWIWMAASLKFLLPFSVLTGIGAWIPAPPQTSTVLTAPSAAVLVESVDRAFKSPEPGPAS
jgi:bla regulator protein blaR1